MTVPPDLASYIIDEIPRESDGTLLGSKIGSFLRVKFPSFQPSNLGGLSKLMADYVSPHLVPIGKKGLDIVYGESGSSKEHETPSPGKNESIPVSPWRIFSNPNKQGVLGVEAQTGQILLLSHPPEKNDESIRMIPRISNQDQRSMIRAFVESNISPAARDQWLEVVDRDDESYWRDFCRLLNKSPVAIKTEWYAFRKSNLQDLLQRWVSGLGLNEHIAEKAMQNLTDRHAIGTVDLQASELNALRELARSIIDKMTVEELRQLKFPLGKMVSSFETTVL